MLKDSADIYLKVFLWKKKVGYKETHTNKILFSHFEKASLDSQYYMDQKDWLKETPEDQVLEGECILLPWCLNRSCKDKMFLMKIPLIFPSINSIFLQS